MNGTQTRAAGTRAGQLTTQLEHLATILEEIDQRLLDLAKIVEEIDKRQVAITQGTADAYDALSKRLDHDVETIETALRNEQRVRNLADGAIDLLLASVGQLQARVTLLDLATFWQRLRWLLTGRT